MTVEQDEAPGALLTVSAVARRLGVAPSTLRTWARRYGLGPSAHASGAHRRYSEADVVRLTTVRRLVATGVTVGDAATHVLAGGGEPDLAGDGPGGTGGAGMSWPADDPAEPVDDLEEALRDAPARVRGLLSAASALDAETLFRLLAGALTRHGVLATWQALCVPLLVAIGERWEQTGEGIEVEHMVSDVLLSVLRQHATERLAERGGGAATGGDPPTAAARPVLLACGTGERHSLPLGAVSAGLAERGVVSRVLGSDLPAQSLAAAVRRTGPSAVFLWSSLPSPHDEAAAASVPVLRPRAALVVGGPGWQGRAPQGARLVGDLPGAVAALAAV